MLLTASSQAKGEVVNVGNTQEVTILELAKKVKEITKCKSTIEFHPLPKDDPEKTLPRHKQTGKACWVETNRGL